MGSPRRRFQRTLHNPLHIFGKIRDGSANGLAPRQSRHIYYKLRHFVHLARASSESDPGGLLPIKRLIFT